MPVAPCKGRPRALLFLLLWFLPVCGFTADLFAAQSSATVLVSAAISLKDALDELGQTYQLAHPGIAIRFNYGGSGTLQHQIEQGAPVDLFVSAAAAQIDALQSKGLIVPKTRRDIVGNTLVLIVPANSQAIRSFKDLGDKKVALIAVGDPQSVPAGLYARQTLEHLGLLSSVEGKFVFAKDVRQVLNYVETGNADAGIVYKTDALISPRVRVVATAPANSHDLIVYPGAVIQASKSAPAAAAFLNFLAGPQARAVFEKFGFIPPEKAAENN
jgi:molybdate transport system substrate-binding protein